MPLATTPPADDAPGAAAYAAILEAVARAPDPAASLRVTTWILDSMADTLALLAFASACDECAEAGVPHPHAPGPGEDYADGMARAGVPDGVRADAQRAAVLLYAAILAAPGGYDPAPAVSRWYYAPHDVPNRWWRRSEDPLEAAARCWGHYAVMSAVGHGVSWEDDNEPLTRAEYDPTNIEQCTMYLPSVGDLRVSAEDITWSDEYTRAAWAVLEARRAREDAARAEADEDEARQERALAAARTRADGEG